jgi:hypothetical protein
MQTKMDEGTGRFWTVVFGGITTLSLIGGGLYTANQYLHSKELDEHNRQNEARNYALQLQNAQLQAKMPFFSKQLELCNGLSETAATLAVVKEGKKRKEALEKYWIEFFGPLRVFGREAVFTSAVKFGECLNNFCDGESIQERALDIAGSCRAEIAEDWDVKLTMPEQPPKRK